MRLPVVLLDNRLLPTRLAPGVIVAAVWVLGARLDLAWLGGGTGLVVVGQALRVWAAGHLVKRTALTTSGPFAHTRHPLYWGSVVMGLGLCVASGLWWSYLLVAAVFAGFYVPTLLDEEWWLRQVHGEDYARYARAVPRFAIRLRGYRGGGNPGGGFSWRRAMASGERFTLVGTALLLAALWARYAGSGGMG